MTSKEFKRLFLFRLAGRCGYFDYCFMTSNGYIYKFSHSGYKRDHNGCWNRIFSSEKNQEKSLTWQQNCKIDEAPLVKSIEEAYRKSAR